MNTENNLGDILVYQTCKIKNYNFFHKKFPNILTYRHGNIFYIKFKAA